MQEVTRPKFSVLISIYINEKAEYMEQCIKSLLNQTVLPDEILVVEDGPISNEMEALLKQLTDENPVLIRTVSYERNRGLGYALAVGINECKYDLIARMDADDIARKDRFQLQLQKFIEDPNLDICGSFIDEFEGDENIIVTSRKVPLSDEEIKKYQRRRDAFNHVTVMYKKNSVLNAGSYKECPLMEDTYLWVRMMKNNAKCVNIGESLVYVRIGREMYERRGGWGYYQKYRAGMKTILKTGYISMIDYYITTSVQLVVALLPNDIRGIIFKKVLHKR